MSRQIRLLDKLGAERGRAYQVRATRKQASARIAQILAATKPTTNDEEEVQAAA